MKSIIFSLALGFLSITSFAQVDKSLSPMPDSNQPLLTVEASCGECNYDMPGNSCDVAIKMDGKTYYVDGVGIMDYGFPHNKGGFCVAVHKAEVQGKVVNGRFKATYFKLLGVEKGKAKNHR